LLPFARLWCNAEWHVDRMERGRTSPVTALGIEPILAAMRGEIRGA